MVHSLLYTHQPSVTGGQSVTAPRPRACHSDVLLQGNTEDAGQRICVLLVLCWQCKHRHMQRCVCCMIHGWQTITYIHLLLFRTKCKYRILQRHIYADIINRWNITYTYMVRYIKCIQKCAKMNGRKIITYSFIIWHWYLM